MRAMVDPRLPTEEEVANHELTHLPYRNRNWCPAGVKAKGKDLDHRGAVDKERKLSEYSFDYCFPGDEFGYKLTDGFGRYWEVDRYEVCNGCPYERVVW